MNCTASFCSNASVLTGTPKKQFGLPMIMLTCVLMELYQIGNNNTVTYCCMYIKWTTWTDSLPLTLTFVHFATWCSYWGLTQGNAQIMWVHGVYTLAQVLSNCIKQHFSTFFFSSVSGDKSSLSGDKSCWVMLGADHSRPDRTLHANLNTRGPTCFVDSNLCWVCFIVGGVLVSVLLFWVLHVDHT